MHWATPPTLPSVQAQAHDLQGAEVLWAQIATDPLIADKAFDVHERVIDRLKRNGKSAVIPSKSNRRTKRPYDQELYKARHLIENFFCKLSSIGLSLLAMTKQQQTSSPLSISPPLLSGSIEVTP